MSYLPTYLPTYPPSTYLCFICLILSTYYLPKLHIYLATYLYSIYLFTYQPIVYLSKYEHFKT
jgi:hypothetical protein